MADLCTTPGCGRALTTEGAHRRLCHHCETHLRSHLHELLWQLPHLHASLHPDSSPTTGTIHTGRAHSPLPARGDVLNLLAAGSNSATLNDPYGDARHDQTGPLPINTLLLGWAEMLTAHIRLAPAPGLRPGHTWIAWHIAYLPWTLTTDWAGQFLTEITELLHQVRAITRTEPRRRTKDAPCPSCDAFGLVEEDWAPYIECTLCGLLLTPAEYQAHARQVLPALYRTALLITAAHQQTEQEDAASAGQDRHLA